MVRALGGAGPGHASIESDGRRVTVRGPADARRAGIAFLPEDRQQYGIIPEQSVASNIALSSLSRWGRMGLISQRAIASSAERYAKAVDIRGGTLATRAHQLSGGNQQKVLLARCLAANARILVIEEPTHGVDVGAKAEIHQLLRDVASRGTVIVAATTDVAEALRLCDRIVVMRHRRVAAVVDATDTTEEELTMLGATDRKVLT